jgi:hypothetical protein
VVASTAWENSYPQGGIAKRGVNRRAIKNAKITAAFLTSVISDMKGWISLERVRTVLSTRQEILKRTR